MLTISFFVAMRNKDGTVGASVLGVRSDVLSPDPITGDGEIIVSSRGLFMGYLKVINQPSYCFHSTQFLIDTLKRFFPSRSISVFYSRRKKRLKSLLPPIIGLKLETLER